MPAIIRLSEAIAELGGNGDGKPDPGETLSIAMTLENFGAEAYGVTAKVLSTGGFATVIDSVAQFFDMATGDTADNIVDPFTIAVDPATPPGSSIGFLLIVQAQGAYTDTSAFSVYVAAQPQEEDEPEDLHTISQNYPNPFSGVTTITYTIPRAGPVRISLYSASGRWIRTLVDQIKEPGNYSLTLNGYGLKPGAYIIRLETPTKSLTRACMIIK